MGGGDGNHQTILEVKAVKRAKEAWGHLAMARLIIEAGGLPRRFELGEDRSTEEGGDNGWHSLSREVAGICRSGVIGWTT